MKINGFFLFLFYMSVDKIYQSLSQAVEAVVHCQHLVALEDPDPDS